MKLPQLPGRLKPHSNSSSMSCCIPCTPYFANPCSEVRECVGTYASEAYPKKNTRDRRRRSISAIAEKAQGWHLGDSRSVSDLRIDCFNVWALFQLFWFRCQLHNEQTLWSLARMDRHRPLTRPVHFSTSSYLLYALDLAWSGWGSARAKVSWKDEVLKGSVCLLH